MRPTPSLLALAFGLQIAGASLAVAQTAPAAVSAPTATPPTPAAQPTPPPAVDDYVYRPIAVAIRSSAWSTQAPIRADDDEACRRPATFMVGDISVRGVMQTRDALVAMVQGPDNRTYLVHQGDKLADGVIKTVTPQGLVVMQDINDPLSTQKQREVRKLLRSLEDTKE